MWLETMILLDQEQERMAYNEFTLSGVARQFHLTIDQTRDLYSHVAPLAVSGDLQAMLVETVPLALVISSEKARSERIIAPILLELWRIMGKRLGLFTGVESNINASRSSSARTAGAWRRSHSARQVRCDPAPYHPTRQRPPLVTLGVVEVT